MIMRQKKRRSRHRKGSLKQPQEEKRKDVENICDVNIPRSMVFNYGKVVSSILELISDFREVMKPNTAYKLKTVKRNTISDFVSMAGPLGVSHLIFFTQTDLGIYLRIIRMPQGPTLSFRVESYCLKKDIVANQTKQMNVLKTGFFSPCLITNLQPSEGENHLQLCSKMFLDMFPTISPDTIKPSSIKRCCLFHYNKEDSIFDFRQYFIKVRPVGISKGTRKLMSKNVPDLSSYKDISEFIYKSENVSEGEECESSQVLDIKDDEEDEKTMKKKKSSVKLYEIGPRMSLKLMKIEEGVWNGQVLYHSYIQKTNEDILEAEEKKKKRRTLKKMRQKEQERNVELKQQKKESHRQRCLEGMGFNASNDKDQELFPSTPLSDEDEAQYYREEVGEEPTEDLFKGKRRRTSSSGNRKFSKKSVK